MFRRSAAPALLALVLAIPAPAHAQWATTTTADNIVCNAAGAQNDVTSLSDGAGGFVSVWRDLRLSGHQSLYAQRLDADGFALWPANGVVVDTTVGTLVAAEACPDDSGGVIVAWYRATGTTANRVYAQRVDALGQLRWGTGGVRVGTSERTQTLPDIVPDGSRGAIVVWANWGSLSTANVYGQRLSPDGVRLWSDTGDSLVARGEVRSLVATARPGGGAYVGWWQTYGIPSAVAVDAARTRVMGVDTITTAASQTSPPGLQAVTSGDGAVFMMAGGIQMHLRRFGSAGGTWPSSVRAITGSWTQSHPQLSSDGQGGALLAWRDGRPTGGGVFAQRVLADGTPAWTPDGVFVSNNVTSNGGGHAIAPDDLGGAWLGWSNANGRMVQHLQPGGGPWLDPAGIYVSTVSGQNYTYDQSTFVPGTNSSAIFVWATNQNAGTNNDVRAKRILGNGSLTTTGVGDAPAPLAGLALAAGPNPARERVGLRFALPRAGRARLEVFGLAGERVAVLADGEWRAGEHALEWNTSALAPGVYLVRFATREGAVTKRLVRVR